jgi:hypothetical protein
MYQAVMGGGAGGNTPDENATLESGNWAIEKTYQ